MANGPDTVTLNRIKRADGAKAAKAWALALGYAVRWDKQGNLYIRDLLGA